MTEGKRDDTPSSAPEGLEITVRDMVNDPQISVRLRCVAGDAGLERPLRHPRVQKSGLALAGHFHGVVPTRVQILGETELAYLDALSGEGRSVAARGFFSLGLSCVVITGDHEPSARLHHRGRSHGDAAVHLQQPLEPHNQRPPRRPRRSPGPAHPAARRAGRRLRHRAPPSREERHRQERVRARSGDARASPGRRRRRPCDGAHRHGLRARPTSCATTSRCAASASSTSRTSSA